MPHDLGLEGLVEFVVSEHSVYTEGETFPVWDCIASLVTGLHDNYNLTYIKDYSIDESYINRSGSRILVMRFIKPEDAMLVTLGGIDKVEDDG